MHNLAATLPAFLLVLLLPAVADAGPRPKIIDGDNASPGELPYQVLINDFCGGSIVDSTHVVTAAHCVVDDEGFNPRIQDAAEFTVSHGGVDRDLDGAGAADDGDLTEVGVQHVSVDPRYLRSDPNAYDMAILELDTALDLSGPNTKPIQLITVAEQQEAFDEDLVGTISGWGLTEEGNGSSDAEILQKADVPLVDDGTCADEYPELVESVMICAGSFSTGAPVKDACQGDSGGPLALANSTVFGDTEPRLAGLVSFGNGCGQVPNVYTEVSEAATRAYIESPPDDVDAPVTAGRPTISGTFRVGGRVTCNPPSVPGATVTSYVWSVVSGSSASRLAATGRNITLPPIARDRAIACDARLENRAGFFYSESDIYGPVGGAAQVTPRPDIFVDPRPDIFFEGFPGRASLRGVLRRGLRGGVACDERCTFKAALILPKKASRKIRLGRRATVVSRARGSASAFHTAKVRFKFKRRVARKLRRLKRGATFEIKITAVDDEGLRKTETKKIRLKR